MTYDKEQRLEIGRRVYINEISARDAMYTYDLSITTVKNYAKEYMESINVPTESSTVENLNKLTKEQLIDEVIKARVDVERAKKGYAVKGGGQEKEYINLLEANTK
ncbi:MAG: hypothetical protein J6Y68_03505 [Clostridia bacterium]|nr:hypothetical protein [Clostridia bacterium]